MNGFLRFLLFPLFLAGSPSLAQEAKPTAQDARFEQGWHDFARGDSKRAYSAILVFTAYPDKAVPFLRGKLFDEPTVGLERIPQLLTALNSSVYQARENALQELLKLGRVTRPAVRKALVDPPSLEAKRRYEGLLDKLNEMDPTELHIHRLIQTLELIDTPEARKLMKMLPAVAPKKKPG